MRGGKPDAGVTDSGTDGGTETVTITWISFPKDTFDMGSKEGSSDEKPVHRVEVYAFDMSKTEITVDQYTQCVAAGACTKPRTKEDSEYCNWGYADRGNYPVNCVDWDQAKKFCEWVDQKGRLPSEAEWEYAARSGGQNRKYPWGNQEATCDFAVMRDAENDGCGKDRSWPVCSKDRGNTDQGLCDMAGNVWEWVEDGYQGDYRSAPSSSKALKSEGDVSRVLRGGSWDYDDPDFLRASYRNMYYPTYRSVDVGFRCSRDK